MTTPQIILSLVSAVAGVAWVVVFRPWIDEVALVAACVLCAALAVL